ncbi:3-phosphoshikimate 1-carboxyvinyltransferase [uncultured Sphingosinicella sp.]|uniref:3-phosphoshikimate 1-carboxyvinyltransferase n=1 Tax=uncultured Sphingosinicella sp. TaxID=478748 RepID=UPI0030DC7929|tara:strand:- start:12887 stop:14203 length:1317 start_codon:yes stop_codon:yes gene_type:complete
MPLSLVAEGPLSGRVRVPGDKSISHRALMLGALAVGETVIDGLLEGEDVHATAAAMRAMGAHAERDAEGRWRVQGVGVGGLLQPAGVLEMGNSGTSTRLLAGLVASHAIRATFVGDASLSKRPMQRIITPLSQMGARFSGNGDRLPMTVEGACPALPIEYRLPVASAQVKSAVLLAGLNAPGITRVIESVPTRDHSERMLRGFGADLTVETLADGARLISVRGEAELKPQRITVPGDISSAAFPLVAALVVPGSEVVIENVGLNPTRTGIIDALAMLGLEVVVEDKGEAGGEPVGALRVRHAMLKGGEVDPAIAPLMIDEYPILMVAAAFAEGTTVMRGLEELRVKESDRLAVMAAGLAACGVPVEELEDGIIIHGSSGAAVPGGATVASHLDHRIAMSFAVLGLNAKAPVVVDDARPIATSFPDFLPLMQRMGAAAR